VSREITKRKFAKVYGNEVKIAPKPKHDIETNQEKILRYLVVRACLEKDKTKSTKYVPKKYRFGYEETSTIE